MVYKDFGKRVQQQRKLARLTQEQLSEKAGISLSFLGHIERGTRKASVDTLVKLCNALALSPNLLLQDSLDQDLLGANMEISPGQRRLLREISMQIINYTEEESHDSGRPKR